MSFSLISVHAVQNCLKLGAWAITLSLCVELFVISTVTYICIVLVVIISGEGQVNPKGMEDFPGGPVVKNPPCQSGDVGSTPAEELRSHVLWSS